jgi:hypothetical protein
MILALLAGTKTQTRRIIRMRDGSLMRDEDLSSDGHTVMDFTKHYPHWQQLHSPFGRPGDRLWVRETCRAEELPDGTNGVRYLADNHFQPISNTAEAGIEWVKLYHYGKRRGATVPPIHAPRWTNRLLLEKVVGRVEQLLDISEADAIAEGIQPYYFYPSNACERASVQPPKGDGEKL